MYTIRRNDDDGTCVWAPVSVKSLRLHEMNVGAAVKVSITDGERGNIHNAVSESMSLNDRKFKVFDVPEDEDLPGWRNFLIWRIA